MRPLHEFWLATAAMAAGAVIAAGAAAAAPKTIAITAVDGYPPKTITEHIT